MLFPSLNDDDAAPYDSLTEILFQRHQLLQHQLLFTNSIQRLVNIISSVGRLLPVVHTLFDTPSPETDHYLDNQRKATNYSAWLDALKLLDQLQGNDLWKRNPKLDLYDHQLVTAHLHKLRQARAAKDYPQLLYLVRTTFVRNLGNTGNVNLYRNLYVGTKHLIEEFITECEHALEDLSQGEEYTGIDDAYTLQMFIQTRRTIGRTALVISGGGTFGLIHIGVLLTLLETDLLPRIVSGSSAGAIVASILCLHTNDEIKDLLAELADKRFNIFGTSSGSSDSSLLLVHLSLFLKYGTWYDLHLLQETMHDFLGDLTFRELYNRTGRILNITVLPALVHEQLRLLNHLTAPLVLIWLAVCALCLLPGVFSSSTIYEKNPRTGVTQEWNNSTSVKYVDGSVDNDLPITRLLEMFNVDHIIACQVNPHVLPFLRRFSILCVGGDVETEYSARFKQAVSRLYTLWSQEVMHYLDLIKEIGIARNLCTKAKSVLAQQYLGDITILPQLLIWELNKVLANPTPEIILEFTVRGARATWPKIAIIRNHCAVEFLLDRQISRLRSRLISSHSLPFNAPYTLVLLPILVPPSNTSSETVLVEGSPETPDPPASRLGANSTLTSSTQTHPRLERTLLGTTRPATAYTQAKLILRLLLRLYTQLWNQFRTRRGSRNASFRKHTSLVTLGLLLLGALLPVRTPTKGVKFSVPAVRLLRSRLGALEPTQHGPFALTPQSPFAPSPGLVMQTSTGAVSYDYDLNLVRLRRGHHRSKLSGGVEVGLLLLPKRARFNLYLPHALTAASRRVSRRPSLLLLKLAPEGIPSHAGETASLHTESGSESGSEQPAAYYPNDVGEQLIRVNERIMRLQLSGDDERVGEVVDGDYAP